MTDLYGFKDSNGNSFPIVDQTARNAANSAANLAELDRKALLGVGGRNIAEIPDFASEISSAGSVYRFLHNRFSAGNFDGLLIGDFINVPAGIYGTRKFEIAGADTYYQFGDSAMGHHGVFVDSAPVALPSSDDHVTNGSYIMWNTTATNQGTADENCPYLVSNLHDWEINNFLPALPSELQGYMLNRRALLETRYSGSGDLNASTSWAWKSMGKIWSLSEIEVYGCVIWGTPGFSVGESRQLPLFALNPRRNLNGSRTDWWLRVPSGASASNVCDVDHYGDANNYSATYTWVRPRCGFLLG